MSVEQLEQEVLKLSVEDRVRLAQAIWDSMEDGHPADALSEDELLALALKRDAELDADPTIGLSREEVMAHARRIARE